MHFIFTMQLVLIIASLLAAVSLASPVMDKYTNRYDLIDVDQILGSERLLNSYHKCLMDRGPCTQEGKELKSVLPDALETGCSKCTERQRVASEKVLQYLIENKRSQFDELQSKYDPQGLYRQRYEQEATKRGIKI